MRQKIKKQKLRAVIVCSLAVLLIMFGLIADFIGYRQFTDTLTRHYKEYALSVASEAASIVNADKLEEFLSTGGNTEEFADEHDKLQTLCDTMDVQFIYSVFVSEDYSDITFAIEVVNSAIKNDFAEFPVGFNMDISQGENTIYQPRFRDLLENGSDYNMVVNDRGNVSTGHHIAALVPLRGADGGVKAVLCVQKQMEQLKAARDSYLRSILIATVALIIVAGTGWFFMLRHRLLTPISLISDEARRFAAENTIDPEPVIEKIKYRDELGELAVTIQEMERQTVEYFNEINRINAEKQRVDAELNLARDIQAHMLPSIFPPFPEYSEFDLYATMNPAKEVGGDFYDFFMVDEKHLGIVVADVSGKGVPAALVMVIAKTLIKNYAQLGFSTAEVFTKVNQLLCDDEDMAFFITAWMGILDIESGVLTYSNAGHNPPLLKSGGKFGYLKSPPCLVLTGMPDFEYTQQQLKMNSGDRLFLYTDGVTEATRANGELYGEKRLGNFMNANADAPIDAALKGLRGDIDAFVGGAPQFDDMTMLLLEYKKDT